MSTKRGYNVDYRLVKSLLASIPRISRRIEEVAGLHPKVHREVGTIPDLVQLGPRLKALLPHIAASEEIRRQAGCPDVADVNIFLAVKGSPAS